MRHYVVYHKGLRMNSYHLVPRVYVAARQAVCLVEGKLVMNCVKTRFFHLSKFLRI